MSVSTGTEIAARFSAVPAAAPDTASVQLEPAVGRVLNSRLAVMAILAVAGPLGLPALWLSSRFSKTAKLITTLVFVLATVVFPLALTYYWVEIALRPLIDAFQQAKPHVVH
jgi:hypothetical protein